MVAPIATPTTKIAIGLASKDPIVSLPDKFPLITVAALPAIPRRDAITPAMTGDMDKPTSHPMPRPVTAIDII